MQYSDDRVERDWRSSFHARQLSADTVFGATGIFYGATSTSKVAAGLAAGADMPYLTMSILALSQWVVLMLLFGTLVLRQARYNGKTRVTFQANNFACNETADVQSCWNHCSRFFQQQQGQHGSTSPLWIFLRDWCVQSKWVFLSMLGYGVRQPLDNHMTSHFPGILAAISTNDNVCTELTRNPASRSALHALYRLWRFPIRPSAGSLQHLVHHSHAPNAIGFSDSQAIMVCQGFFTASQLVLAFALPCLWAMRVELQDRVLFLQSLPLRGRGIKIQFSRFLDVLAVMLLEATLLLTMSELVPMAGQR